jgi:hypothetical protein
MTARARLIVYGISLCVGCIVLSVGSYAFVPRCPQADHPVLVFTAQQECCWPLASICLLCVWQFDANKNRDPVLVIAIIMGLILLPSHPVRRVPESGFGRCRLLDNVRGFC